MKRLDEASGRTALGSKGTVLGDRGGEIPVGRAFEPVVVRSRRPSDVVIALAALLRDDGGWS